jgi:hypothetical protein
MKTLLAWCVDRDIFLDEAALLRERFDAERGASSSAVSRLLKVRAWSKQEASMVMMVHRFNKCSMICAPLPLLKLACFDMSIFVGGKGRIV